MKKTYGIFFLIIVLLGLFMFLDKIVEFWINIKWFDEVGYLSTYFTQIIATLKFMLPIFIISFLGIWIYYRSLRKSFIKKNNIVEINNKQKKLEKAIFFTLNFITSFVIAYFTASAYWYRILQFSNSVDFNVKDPIFNKDVSFYIFKLPLIQSIYGAVMGILILLVIITFISYFLTNAQDRIKSMDIKNPFANVKVMKSEFTKLAGKQLAILSALILIMISILYILKAYYLVYSPRGVAFGASYTDVNVTLKFYRVITCVSILCAIVVFISVLKSRIKPIVICIIGIAALIGLESITSNLIQQFIVKSNEMELEKKYIKYNIDYTRKAFKVDSIKENVFQVKNDFTKEDISSNQDIINNIKINSFNPTLDFYNQVQNIRYYYNFNDVDVDRYNIDGKYTQVFLAPREISSDSIEPNTWQNKHLVYTHGYGIVMNKVNAVTSEGQPSFVIKDIPPDNSAGIKLDNPRIYFGENTNYYAIVNTNIAEFDYPKGGENQTNKYNGTAGINMSLGNRILFAINEKNIKFLFSQDINNSSRILINRNIVKRVKKIAPFLEYDVDPYVVINNGKLYWVIDGYTTSNKYPFAEPYSNINYIRNSVKVIVDAFNGDTKFYIADKNDPIINSYSKIFKDLFKDYNEIPKEIKEHFRYPEGLFNIQCSVLGKYHMTDPQVFFNGEDLWDVAKNQKKVEGRTNQNESAYIITRLPEENKEEMVLFEYFNMRDKENMVALLGARMDGDNYGKLVMYKFPPQKTIYSPYLFKNKFNQDPNISKEISLWNTEGSRVEYGDTVIVPIKNSLLYIEPVYLIAQGKNSIPEMKRVIVSYGEKTVIAENIDKALESIFSSTTTKPTENNTTIPSENTDRIKYAKDIYEKALEAQKNGDWAKYGEYIKQLGEVLNELNK